MGLRRKLSRLPWIKQLKNRWMASRYGRDFKDIQWLMNECNGERSDFSLPVRSTSRQQIHLDRYKLACQYASGKCVADIACGTGYGSSMLGQVGKALTVKGVDIDPRCTEYATKYHGGENISFHCANGADTGLDEGQFDLIVSFETIEHVENAQQLLHEFSRLLKPDGKLLISTPNDWGLSVFHVVSYDYQQFINVLSDLFVVEKEFAQYSRNQQTKGGGKTSRICEGISEEDKKEAQIFICLCSKK
ncbi:MAG: class I SAM-dependent methyltransferase [Lentisphaeria bacterium]|nr:class I SAM-dependent methyltransferase [Lentisphaeria bacterium]